MVDSPCGQREVRGAYRERAGGRSLSMAPTGSRPGSEQTGSDQFIDDQVIGQASDKP